MILIVDDDIAIRQSIGLMLHQAKLEFQAVSNEADCLAAVRSGSVELVILDMNLELTTTGEQGIEILRKIKILSPEVPVILISAWGTIPLAVSGMNYGAVDFVTKPWINREFMAKIRRHLESAKQNPQSEKPKTLDEMEQDAIVEAIRLSNGNLSQVASQLGITRQALYRRMEKYGIQQ
jgi:two-component system NtrC family response regulator